MNPTIDAVVRIRQRYPSLADRKVTEHVLVDRGILGEVGALSKRLLGSQVLLVSDPSTYEAAGRDVEASLEHVRCRDLWVFSGL